MRDWLPHRARYLQILLELEARPEGSSCWKCSKPNSLWRCADCHGKPLFCNKCIKEAHDPNPFHRIEKWTGTHFQPASLRDVGVTLCLGHGGQSCPQYLTTVPPLFTDDTTQASDEEEALDEEIEDQEVFSVESGGLDPKTFEIPRGTDPYGNTWITVVHTTGVHHLAVQYCQCPGRSDRHLQLLESGLYPASVRKPKTVFTFQLLDDYYLENLECKTPARNYYAKIRRLTSNLFPHLIPVSSV